MSALQNTNFNRLLTKQGRCCLNSDKGLSEFRRVIDGCILSLYTKLIDYFDSLISFLLTVTVAPLSSISASHTILSPFSMLRILTRAAGIVVVIDPFTRPALVSYVIFIYLHISFFHIYFYRSPYIYTNVFLFVIPYGLNTSKFRNIPMEIFNKNIGMIL